MLRSAAIGRVERSGSPGWRRGIGVTSGMFGALGACVAAGNEGHVLGERGVKRGGLRGLIRWMGLKVEGCVMNRCGWLFLFLVGFWCGIGAHPVLQRQKCALFAAIWILVEVVKLLFVCEED